ncbi:MAG: hypothetical protein MK212_04435 [Saprospiraceae bacterium]|nr:hypothetical protein [Saprospiraceae bacterium]
MWSIFQHILFLVLLGYVVSACNTKSSVQHPLNFYHWKTALDIDTVQKEYLQDLESNRLYLRFFDVDWSTQEKQAVPLAEVSNSALKKLSIQQIVPTVYITNKSLINSSDSLVLVLADHLANKIHHKLIESQQENKVDEIQVDCDWTLKTKERYFLLLKALKKHDWVKNLKLSVTIRLHQVKYAKRTGIPPVDRGILMFYNMGKVNEIEETNSILNLDLAHNYMKNYDDYPLHLDVALPLFSWGVQFRSGRLIRLVNGLQASDLEQSTACSLLKNNWYQIDTSTYIKGRYFYAGDKIRIEKINAKDLSEAVKILRNNLNNPNFEIIFYHLDHSIIKAYPKDTLNYILQ